jgi:hypothetical protein
MQQKIARDEKELEDLLKAEKVAEPEPEPEKVEPEAKPEAEEKNPEPEAKKAEPEERTLPEPTSAEERTFKKRYGDIRKHLADKEQEYKVQIEKLNAQLNSAVNNTFVLPKSEEEIDKWSKKYPEVAAIVESIADKKASEKSVDLDRRLKEIEDIRLQAAADKAEAEIIILHPDFSEIREGDEFHKWAEEQPKWVQDALYENSDDAKSVARVVDLYKADKGIKTKKPSDDSKAAASSVKARRTPAPEADDTKKYLRESEVEKMTAKEYAEHAEEIMAAIQSGKFVYDLKK